MCIKALVLRTALEMKEDNIRHEYTCKVYHFSITSKISNIFVTFPSADDFLQLSPLPKLVNNENETFKISFECNHEEADSRMIFHALKQKTNVLLCSKDTDILVLMVFVYALNKINGKWNISEMTSQQSFPKFTQLQGVTQLLFYMSLIKLKCLKGKEKMRFLNTISVSCKVSYC